MAASGINLVDANVWLALAFSDHKHHAQAKTWFEHQPDRTVAFCRLTQLALLRHLTNSHIMGKFVQSQKDAWVAFDKLASDPRVVFLNEPSGLENSFRNLSQSVFPSQDRWTDAYLAAFGLAASAQVVSFDAGFSRYPGLTSLILHH